MTTASGAVLFTDLVGFTEFTELRGDDAAVRALDRQHEIVSRLLAGRRGARVVKELGDGLLVWFGDAVDGLEGAGSLLSQMDDAHRLGDFPLRVRMGLHVGEVVHRGDDLVGRTVNLAARIAELAGPGELLVSDAVSSVCPQCTFQPIGPDQAPGRERSGLAPAITGQVTRGIGRSASQHS